MEADNGAKYLDLTIMKYILEILVLFTTSEHHYFTANFLKDLILFQLTIRPLQS